MGATAPTRHASPPDASRWRNRIVGSGAVAPDQLLANPLNFRRHPARQQQAMDGVLAEVGWIQNIIVNKTTGHVVDGHLRVELALRAGAAEVPVVYVELTEAEERLALATLDPLSALAQQDDDQLQALLAQVAQGDERLRTLLAQVGHVLPIAVAHGDPELIPPVEAEVVSQLGDVWELGAHRLRCGDSIDPAQVADLLAGAANIPLLHADPPYGMGKEADGVANDNLYRAKLDAFQLAWWEAWRPHLAANASAYIWGNPEDLWRLWYVGGLGSSERLTLRNEIVWSKGAGFGQTSDGTRSYVISTERCLFFMLGDQFFGNVNKGDYWEGFEPIRTYLEGGAKIMAWGAKELEKLTGVQMFGHWFGKSQWTMIPAKHYETLQGAANGRAFTKPYAELRQLYDGQLVGGALSAKEQFYAQRSCFDNTHDNMNEVWEFPRVHGEERHGHATPKPVALLARALKSSAPDGAVVVEPFLGSGSTLIAAEQTGRVCYAMELAPHYVDVCVRRWQAFTGRAAVLRGTTHTFDQLRAQRGTKPRLVKRRRKAATS